MVGLEGEVARAVFDSMTGSYYISYAGGSGAVNLYSSYFNLRYLAVFQTGIIAFKNEMK